MNQYIFKTHLANIILVEKNNYITELSFTEKPINKSNNSLLLNAEKQIHEYFSRTRKNFDLPLNPSGTDFQKKIWEYLTSIKYSETTYYSTIASELGSSPRAVGNACGKNKCLIIIPCHRVVSKNPTSGGFSSFEGLIHKNTLLSLELGAEYIEKDISN